MIQVVLAFLGHFVIASFLPSLRMQLVVVGGSAPGTCGFMYSLKRLERARFFEGFMKMNESCRLALSSRYLRIVSYRCFSLAPRNMPLVLSLVLKLEEDRFD